MEQILLIITNERMNLSKTIDVTEYSNADLIKSTKAYSVNFDVRIKRYV